MKNDKDILERIERGPHWRVHIHPMVYEGERLDSLAKCRDAIEKTSVRVRGCPFPYISYDERGIVHGNNFFGSWSNIMGHMEWWRLYQSGQFIFKSTVREIAQSEWALELRHMAEGRIHLPEGIEWDSVPGFFDIVNFVYRTTEIFEFSARLCQHSVLRGEVNHDISLQNIEGFVLTTDMRRRFWHLYCPSTQAVLQKAWVVDSANLIADSAAHSRDAINWFFERFGWQNPNLEQIKKDQEDLLRR